MRPVVLSSADVDHRLAVGSQFEAFEAAVVGGHDGLLAALEVKGEDFAAAAVHDSLVVEPYGAEFALSGGSQTLPFPTLDGHQVELGVVLVLLHVGVAECVEDAVAVGADGVFAHDTERPHHLGGEAAVLDSHLGFADGLFVRFVLLARGETHSTGGHSQYCFLHICFICFSRIPAAQRVCGRRHRRSCSLSGRVRRCL